MNIQDFISKRNNNESHTKEEIAYFIKNLNSFSQEDITSWLKAVKKNGLSDVETSILTLEMANSGTILNWDGFEPLIDKHSSGGIGDKITFLFVPLIASYKKKKINIAKLSGRGLGITGGTIDKLESIKGFKTNLSISEMKEQIKKIGFAICSANLDLAPADKKLYAIRDVTDTVDSIPLIASSIMSKKIAGGAKNIILDVKFGSGAFMKSKDEAKLLAKAMVSIGKNLNKKIKAVLSNMNEPLGYAIGHSLEIKEVLEVFNGKDISDLVEITVTLAKEVISLVDDPDPNIDEDLKDLLLGGEALKKFKELVIAQGGNTDFATLEQAKYTEILTSPNEGYISSINAQSIGEVVHSLGAGRKEVTDLINHSVGIVLHKKHSNFVKKGDSLLEIHARKKEDIALVKDKLLNSFSFSQNEVPKLKLIEAIIS